VSDVTEDLPEPVRAIYTFEIWPSPMPGPVGMQLLAAALPERPERETLRFLCASKEDAWMALLLCHPRLGAFARLVKTELLSPAGKWGWSIVEAEPRGEPSDRDHPPYARRSTAPAIARRNMAPASH
jgi:hypothetical protein